MILTKEEKIRYVKEYNEGKPIRTPDGFRSRAAFKNSLLNWVKRYNLEGEKGLDRKPSWDSYASKKELPSSDVSKAGKGP